MKEFFAFFSVRVMTGLYSKRVNRILCAVMNGMLKGMLIVFVSVFAETETDSKSNTLRTHN